LAQNALFPSEAKPSVLSLILVTPKVGIDVLLKLRCYIFGK
jgi:hypothetical protein